MSPSGSTPVSWSRRAGQGAFWCGCCAASSPPCRLGTESPVSSVASQDEFDEFDLNAFFAAEGTGSSATFKHADDVQKWLDIIRGTHLPTQVDLMKAGSRPPFPYSDARLLEFVQHSF